MKTSFEFTICTFYTLWVGLDFVVELLQYTILPFYVISANSINGRWWWIISKITKNSRKIMLINYNNTEVWTRTVMELKLSVAIFILVGLF
jgi:hypothetical protein